MGMDMPIFGDRMHRYGYIYTYTYTYTYTHTQFLGISLSGVKIFLFLLVDCLLNCTKLMKQIMKGKVSHNKSIK